MGGFNLNMSKLTCYWLIIVSLSFPVITNAAEVSALSFTEFNSFMALRYLFDEQSVITEGVISRKETLPTFQEEFGVSSQAYVFHPNMLNMELDGSILFDQSEFESLQGESDSNSQLFNYYARLNFLEKKSYPLSIYFSQQHPTVYTGLAGHYLQKNTRQGFDFSILQPFTPVQVVTGAFRETSKGGGGEQITDEIREQANIRFYRAYGSGNYMQLSYQLNRLDSKSGSTNLPIEQRIFEADTTNFDSRNTFGANKQLQLTNTLGYSTQDEFPVRKDFNFRPNLNWRHSKLLRSFYRYDFSKVSEEDQDTNDHRMTLGVAYSGQSITSTLNVHGEDNETTGVANQSAGTNYSIAYTAPLYNGVLTVNYGGSYDLNDQQSEVSSLQIFEEPHLLEGTTPVFLEKSFIDINSIIVRNGDRTQIYLLNRDYRIIVIGSQTQIQRLLTGEIPEEEPVVSVDYTYNTGGTYKFDLLSQNFSIGFAFARYYEIYLRQINLRQDLIEGDPTVPLNSINRSMAGVSADRPLPNGMTIGGEISYENNDEDISSYVRENYDVFIEMPLPQLTDIRLSARWVQVDNENTDEDVDLNGYILRINSRPWLRTAISLESSYENDTGGSIDRLTQQHRLQIGWRVRQLSVSFNALYSTEEQGNSDRERWSAQVIARREF